MNSHEDFYFPKSFDCNEKGDYADFLQYYKVLRAECILKKILDLARVGNRGNEEYLKLMKIKETAIVVTRRRLMDLGELIES